MNPNLGYSAEAYPQNKPSKMRKTFRSSGETIGNSLALMAKSNLAYNKIAEREAKEMQELLKKSLPQDLEARSGRESLDSIPQAMKIAQKEKLKASGDSVHSV